MTETTGVPAPCCPVLKKGSVGKTGPPVHLFAGAIAAVRRATLSLAAGSSSVTAARVQV